MTTFDISGKVCLITGAASGLGALIAEELLKEGAKFAALLDITEERGKVTEERLNKIYGGEKVKFFLCDVTNEEQLSAAYEGIIDLHKQIDIVINNAGIMNDSKHIFKKAIEVNYTAVVNSSLKALEHMRADCGGAGGTILNVASTMGVCRFDPLPIYSGAKSAVVQFSNLLGAQDERFAFTKVRVLAMCFHATDTPLLHDAANLGLDERSGRNLDIFIKGLHVQRPESAVRGVLAALRRGASGSTWLAADDLPPRDITDNVRRGYELMMN